MEFFQKLSSTGEVDITMRIMQKNDKLTINIMPGSQVSNIKPLIFTGTPEDIDAGFFDQIMPGVQEVKGLISNLQEVKKEAAPNPKPAEKSKDKKSSAGKKNAAKKKTPEPKEGDLFDTSAAGETQEEDDNAADADTDAEDDSAD